MDLYQTLFISTAPLVLVLIGLSIAIRRHGALRWAAAVTSSWLAAISLSVAPDFSPLTVALGSATPALFVAAARRYAGLAPTRLSTATLVTIPLVVTAAEWIHGPHAGQIGMAICDTVMLGLAARLCWPRGPLESLLMARLLPGSLIAFIPVCVFYGLSVIMGAPLALPTALLAVGFVFLSAMVMLAIGARVAREETLERERLEARIRDQADALVASEEKAREAERLASIGTLAAGVAHQINNPIGAILAAAQFELRERPRTVPMDDTTRTLRVIEREAIRCGRVVRNILLFARGRPGHIERVDLNDLVDSAVRETQLHAKSESALIDWERSAHPLPIEANEIEIEEAVVNLITNAIESHPGARIIVRTNRNGKYACCSVEDDGPGIPREDRERLFEPFFSTKTKEGGSGLGLSVAHGVLTGHGGDLVHVEREGPGACFRLRLPLAIDYRTRPTRTSAEFERG